jgi:mannonate dehydratase
MKRRDFGRLMAAGSVGTMAAGSNKGATSANAAPPSPKPKKAKMHAGGNITRELTTEELQFFKRHGVNNVLGGENAIPFTPGKGWELSDVLDAKEKCAKEGISLDLLPIPSFPGTTNYRQGTTILSPKDTNFAMRNIVAGKSPERDREIETICRMIEVTAKAGIRGLHYSFLVLPHQRTESTPGRGGVRYSTFDRRKVTDHSITPAGRVTRSEVFDRIAYFHERVIPVAQANKVQMACHQPDPPLEPNFRGVDQWDYPAMDGLKRFVETVDSPYNGLTFCVGTVSEALENINGIYEIVRYFGQRKKILHVHFRNIRGGLNNFYEVFPDEGEIDMYKLAKVFRDVEYPYMFQVDHTPGHSDPGASRQAYAFQLGYIIAMIQAVNSEAA